MAKPSYRMTKYICTIALALLPCILNGQNAPSCSFDLKEYATDPAAWAGTTAYAGLAWPPTAGFGARLPQSLLRSNPNSINDCVQAHPMRVTFTVTAYVGPDSAGSRRAQMSLNENLLFRQGSEPAATVSEWIGPEGGTLTFTLTRSSIQGAVGLVQYIPFPDVGFSIGLATECNYGNIFCGGGSRYYRIESAEVTIESTPYSGCYIEPALTSTKPDGSIDLNVIARFNNEAPKPGQEVQFNVIESPEGYSNQVTTQTNASGWATYTLPSGLPPGVYKVKAQGPPCLHRNNPNTYLILTATVAPRCTIDSLTFESRNNSPSSPEVQTATGGGLRAFVEKEHPAGPVQNELEVVVKLASPFSGNISIRLRDPDDPESDPLIDSNGNQGDDNYGGKAWGVDAGSSLDHSSTITRTLSNSDELRIPIKVTGQPGDNFRAMAYCEGTTPPVDFVDSDPKEIAVSPQARLSPILTVWRTLHVQTQAMQPVTEANLFEAAIVSASYSAVDRATRVYLDRNVEDSTRFMVGNIFNNPVSYARLKNRTELYGIRIVRGRLVLVDGDLTRSGQSLMGQTLQLIDDDQLGTGSPSLGAVGQSFTPATQQDLDAVSLLFQPAYIKVKQRAASSVPPGFKRNIDTITYPDGTTEERSVASLFPPNYIDAQQDENFWNVYVLTAFQHAENLDGDGLNDGFVFGEADNIPGTGLVLFEGTYHDPGVPSQFSVMPWHLLAAHELGHTIGGEHGFGDLMEEGSKWTPMMSSFGPESICRFRAHSWAAPYRNCTATSVTGTTSGSTQFKLQLDKPHQLVLGQPLRLVGKIINNSSEPFSLGCWPGVKSGQLRLFLKPAQGDDYSEIHGLGWGTREQFCPATTLPPNAAIPISVTTLTNWQNRPAQGELVFEQPGNYTLRVVARLDGENTASTEIPIEVVDPETPGEQELFDLLRAHPSYGELLESGSLDRLERRNPQSHIDAVQRFETVLSLLGEQQSELKALIEPVRNSRKELK